MQWTSRLGKGYASALTSICVNNTYTLQFPWSTPLTGEGGCCLKVPTKSFSFCSVCVWCVLGPSLSSVAKWNSLGCVRLSTADLHGMYDCPARAFFMETLFCFSFSWVSFCFCAMTSNSEASLDFCAWLAAIFAWGTLLKRGRKIHDWVRWFINYDQLMSAVWTVF